MKKSIFALLALIFVNFLIAQNKCEETPTFSVSKVLKNNEKISSYGKSAIRHLEFDKYFYLNDGSVLASNKFDDSSYLLQYFDQQLNLKTEKELKINEKKRWGKIENVIKKEDGFYLFTLLDQKKGQHYYQIKYDLELNFISKKLIIEIPKHKRENILASSKNFLGFELYNNNSNFKISYANKKEVFVFLYDINLNKINNYSFTDISNKSYGMGDKTTSLLSHSSNDGTFYTLYNTSSIKAFKRGTINKKYIRRISSKGEITVKEADYGIPNVDNGFFKETDNDFTFVVASSRKSKTYINGFDIVTYNKSDLSIKQSTFVPIKKHKISIAKQDVYTKFIKKGNELYISLEPHSSVFSNNNFYDNYHDIYLYKINLSNESISWENKIGKKNDGYGMRKNAEYLYSFSWMLKEKESLIFLNSNKKRVNNKFITKRGGTPSLFCIKVNNESGEFCYKKIQDNNDVVFGVNEEISINNSLLIVGKNKKESTYQLLKL